MPLEAYRGRFVTTNFISHLKYVELDWVFQPARRIWNGNIRQLYGLIARSCQPQFVGRVHARSSGQMSGDRPMIRSHAVTCRTIRIHDTTITVTCPKCKTSRKLFRTTNATIDSCGFETYSFRCEWCATSFAGVIDPSDDELPVSILEPASNTLPHTETEKDQGQCSVRRFPIGAGKDQA